MCTPRYGLIILYRYEIVMMQRVVFMYKFGNKDRHNAGLITSRRLLCIACSYYIVLLLEGMFVKYGPRRNILLVYNNIFDFIYINLTHTQRETADWGTSSFFLRELYIQIWLHASKSI